MTPPTASLRGEPAAADVLVVGAGPTGLMLALQLARRGVRPLVVDKADGPSVATKALGVQARTLEIYARLGLAEAALERGKRADGANMWVAGRRAARVPLGDIGRDLSPFPFLLILGQDDNERLLGEALRRHGVEVAWSTELVALEREADGAQGVTATLRGPDGARRAVRAAWVAGCDGAHSAVRTLRGIDFPGAPYEHVFFVADTRATGPMVPDELNVYLWRSGFHLFFPLHGDDHWRIVGIVPAALRGRDDLAFEEVLPALHAELGARLAVRECTWFSTYRIHHRRAARFRDGRCFLLGDAAHVHSPVGAQGMNTGLQDAYNLAWKLAYVVAGRADERLLDSYAAEREPVAERLLETTDRAFALVISERRMASALRLRVLPRLLAFAMRRDGMRRLAFRTLSQIGIHYRGSPLSRDLGPMPAGGPRAGDRFPWMRLAFTPGAGPEDLYARIDDTRFCLLCLGRDPPRDLPGGPDGPLAVLRVPDDPVNARELARVRIAAPSAWLLRPDGHVGMAGTHVDAAGLGRYLEECAGIWSGGTAGRPVVGSVDRA